MTEKVFPFRLTIVEKTIYEYQEIVQPLGTMNNVIIEANINIPFYQEVKYIPGILETLKYAWI